ncbi:disulfide bond formation protein DsbD [Terrihabitans soli]|uniref:Disulfide bond formation protein DsbD n=1 Tax=Terrihabitans soli TaxID=708113 RepID=A0A6S6QLH8_9HYPH|nr:DsbA family protein [Terrihabitans soli]BCJ90166.1 disulfide bond formation protein DsbD [Terrihabitans soli]
MKRQTMIAVAAAAVIVAGIAGYFVYAIQSESGGSSLLPGAEQSEGPAQVSMEELLAPGPIPDHVLGPADAPVTVVEYASLTCSHCKAFHEETFSEVKKRYIDTGKIRFIFRDFPLDQFATAGAMLGRCAGEGKYFPIADAFFDQQDQLRAAPDPFVWLQSFAKQVGFTQESFEACLSNQSLTDNILAVRQRASEKFGVSSTPTFFFNGKVRRGGMTIEEFEQELGPLLKK